MKKMAYKLTEAAELLSVSYSTINRMIERGDISTVKIGTLRRVPLSEIERMLKIEGEIR